MDGYVVCPTCGRADDGAAMFGDAIDDSTDERDWGLFDGLIGRCAWADCGAGVRLRLEPTDEPPTSPRPD
jgi:hypothetical protein